MARGNAVTKPCEACGTAFTARAADIARGWGRFCSKSCKARQPKDESAGAPQPEPMRAHVEDMATRNGWKREDGEGAIEFLMRNAYATGREDTLREQRPAPVTIDSAALQCARKAYSNATGLGTSKTGMFAALKAARDPNSHERQG